MINFKKVKSVVLSGMMAVASVAGSFVSAAPSLNAAAAGSDDYAKLLQYSLYFYDANMCGDEVGQKSGMTWRGNCHTSDEVNGGFHDAGDHAMFGLPQGFAASVLGVSYYEFKDAYDATGQGEHLKVVTDHFCDFFKRSTKLDGNRVSNFLYQKGDGDEDHSYWGPPEKQGGSRRMFWTSNGASDIAADYAAALALNYLNFGNTEDLKYAEALYNFSTQYNQVAVEGTIPFYKSSSCQDEQANAAGWLYIATKNEKYKNDCAGKQAQYLGWVDGWENRELGAATVYAEITGDWSKVNDWIGSKANGNGYFFLDKWGSARINCSMQLSALIASKHSNADYTSWCQGQMDFILGQNPANTCLVIGYAANSAKNPHHRAASGFNSYNEFNGENHPQSISPNGHSLIGALVGGPTDASGGGYVDDMNDYVANEVAIDYNAGLVGAAAGLYHFKKTGRTVSSIEGVDKIYSGSVTPTPTPTEPSVTPPTTTANQNPSTITTTPVQPSGGDIVLTPSDMKVGSEKGDDGEINNYAEFSPKGAKSATLYLTVKSNDTEVSGAFGTWTGTWDQEDFTGVKVGADKTVAIDYTIPSKVGSTVKAMVFWPHGDNVVIDKIVLHTGSSSTPTPTPTNPPTTTPPTSSGNGQYENKLNQSVDYNKLPENDKMIGWEWADFGIGANETIKKVEINISANGNIGKWQGAFGSSTKVSPDYWTQTDEMEQTFSGNKGTITWNIDSATAKIIQTQYGGELKFGIWWIDCKQFTIDSIKVYTDGSSTVTPTNPPATNPPATNPPATNPPTGNVSLYGDANCDGKVTIADSTAILQHLGNQDKYGLSAQGLANADVCNNGDGVMSSDALAIQMVDASILKASDLPVKKLPN